MGTPGRAIGITLTVGTYLYGRYWLPKVYGAENGFPWSFFLLISASVTEMMQVAMNEWGHSLWITEEIFAVPFHWPFVLYGWLAAGIFVRHSSCCPNGTVAARAALCR